MMNTNILYVICLELRLFSLSFTFRAKGDSKATFPNLQRACYSDFERFSQENSWIYLDETLDCCIEP